MSTLNEHSVVFEGPFEDRWNVRVRNQLLRDADRLLWITCSDLDPTRK